jgi:CheY-like chemotaxis protein/two-component sensor histidine kinase
MSQVSHELRTPLNSILGFAQLMAMDTDHPLGEAQQKRLQELHHSGQRLLTLVDQLLQIGRIEQGKAHLKPRPVNVRSLVRRCVDAMIPMAEERDVSLEIDIAGDGSASVRADSQALEQILVNLLSNAIKYNHRGGKVVIRFRALEFGAITVEDYGPGLTSSQVARLFEPFNRLGAQNADIQGTGLGLVISRRLVESMRGVLDVWSEPGVGSRFRVALPRARASRNKDYDTLALGMPSQWTSESIFRVLYIEDDDANIVLLDQAFSMQSGWSLNVAMTGAAGIVEAVRHQPDLILLDLMLPDMTGWEVLKRLRQDRRTQDIPVIAVSADAMTSTFRRSRPTGLLDYWTKPLDLREAIGQLKSLCNERPRRK